MSLTCEWWLRENRWFLLKGLSVNNWDFKAEASGAGLKANSADDKWTFHGETHISLTTQQGKFSLGYLRKYLQCHLPLVHLSCKELT